MNLQNMGEMSSNKNQSCSHEGRGGRVKAMNRDLYHHHLRDIRVIIITRGISLHHRRVMDVPTSAGRDHLVIIPDPHYSLL